MRNVFTIAMIVALIIVGCLSLGAALSQTMQPGTNTPLMGCVEGRALRILNGYPACSSTSTPTISGCGLGSSISALSTDFVGQVTTGTSLLSTCTITLSKLYASLGCIAQSNSTSAAVAGSPVVGSANGKTTISISLTATLFSGKITYTCFPV